MDKLLVDVKNYELSTVGLTRSRQCDLANYQKNNKLTFIVFDFINVDLAGEAAANM